MAEHTPGPWYPVENDGPDELPPPYSWDVWNNDSPPARAIAHDVFSEADARLIAAAPDLLAALETLLDNGDDPHPLTGRDPTVRREDIGPARAAIASAKGEKDG